MPSESFWEPSQQFRSERTANVLNSSLGGLSEIDSVLASNENAIKRQQNPILHVPVEDRPSDSQLETMLDYHFGEATRVHDIDNPMDRPAPNSPGYVGTSVQAFQARQHPIGSPEYWSAVDTQNKYNQSRGPYDPYNTHNDFFRIHDDNIAVGAPSEELDNNHLIVGRAAWHYRPVGSTASLYPSRTTTPRTQATRTPTTRGLTRGLVRAHMGRSGSNSVNELLASGQPFYGGARRTGPYPGTYGVFTPEHLERFGLGRGRFTAYDALRSGGRSAPQIENFDQQMNDLIEHFDSIRSGSGSRIAYSYNTPIAWHVPEEEYASTFGEQGKLSPSREQFHHVTTSEGNPLGRGAWVMPRTSYSRTTSKHQGVMLRALSNMQRYGS
jgi:hypothetical protein